LEAYNNYASDIMYKFTEIGEKITVNLNYGILWIKSALHYPCTDYSIC